ncbi:conserved hypothetical protein [Ricinus communis]|uniref:Uncharacterized protein n=1 Tax=Ricinus communis TaxID=3988 RepID=B9TJW4_RICCO|nr:conserved hypothetical protein [Ricinus communis]
MEGDGSSGADNCNGTIRAGSGGASLCASITRASAARIQVRSRLSFTWWAMATAAMEVPGWRHCSTSCALKSSVCLRRRRSGEFMMHPVHLR